MAAASEQPQDVAVAAHDQSTAIMLDLVHPAQSSPRLGGATWGAGLDEASE
jgi:hypothetical protein